MFVCTVGGISLIISIHALHEESDFLQILISFGQCISIHALHEESDLDGAEFGAFGVISIHALHEESDLSYLATYPRYCNFNPRSP